MLQEAICHLAFFFSPTDDSKRDLGALLSLQHLKQDQILTGHMKTSLWSLQHFTANNMSRRPLVDDQPQFPQNNSESVLETVEQGAWRPYVRLGQLQRQPQWTRKLAFGRVPFCFSTSRQTNNSVEFTRKEKVLWRRRMTWRITTERLASKKFAVTKQTNKPLFSWEYMEKKRECEWTAAVRSI